MFFSKKKKKKKMGFMQMVILEISGIKEKNLYEIENITKCLVQRHEYKYIDIVEG